MWGDNANKSSVISTVAPNPTQRLVKWHLQPLLDLIILISLQKSFELCPEHTSVWELSFKRWCTGAPSAPAITRVYQLYRYKSGKTWLECVWVHVQAHVSMYSGVLNSAPGMVVSAEVMSHNWPHQREICCLQLSQMWGFTYLFVNWIPLGVWIVCWTEEANIKHFHGHFILHLWHLAD